MFTWAKSQGMDWGVIGTIPEIPGIAVRFDGHVGVYIGNGYVVEERGFAYGCVKTRLKDRKWTHWYKLPFINYVAAEETTPLELGDRILQLKSNGPDVKTLQEILVNDLDYDLGDFGENKDGIDSDYGKKTEAAVKRVQLVLGVPSTGIYDQVTHKVLMTYLSDIEAENGREDVDELPSVASYVLECTGGSVRIREGNGTEYEILTKTSEGKRLEPILGKDGKPLISNNNWYAIKIGGKIAWISGKYIKEIKV